MSWLTKVPWLSPGLLLLTYSIFGWIVAASTLKWSYGIAERATAWGWILEEDLAQAVLYVLSLLAIATISVILTFPAALLTFFLFSSLRSDFKAMVWMLVWAFAFVVMLRWFEYFTRLLILVCAAILARLDLRAAGYNSWQTFAILMLLCLGGFALGISSYWFWHQQTLVNHT